MGKASSSGLGIGKAGRRLCFFQGGGGIKTCCFHRSQRKLTRVVTGVMSEPVPASAKPASEAWSVILNGQLGQ